MMTTLLDTGRTFRRAGIALAAGASLFAMAGAAFAVPQIRITSVDAEWTSTTDGSGIVHIPVGGGPTAEVRWGSPSNVSEKSGYKFTGVTPLPTDGYAADTNFALGEFTHFNNPINAGTSITQAILTLTFGANFSVDGGTTWSPGTTSFAAEYIFKHNETTNDPAGGALCANGLPNRVPGGVNSNGCADNVLAILNSNQEVAFDDGAGGLYFLSISGFEVGGTLFDSFWTKEEADNSASLIATFTAKPNVIPLPAAVWMLVGGIGALGAVARRRRAATEA